MRKNNSESQLDKDFESLDNLIKNIEKQFLDRAKLLESKSSKGGVDITIQGSMRQFELYINEIEKHWGNFDSISLYNN